MNENIKIMSLRIKEPAFNELETLAKTAGLNPTALVRMAALYLLDMQKQGFVSVSGGGIIDLRQGK